MTTILLLGAGGQLGQEIACRAGEFAIRVVAHTRRETDIGEAAMVLHSLETVSPDIVVNAAAYTRVDRAEDEKDEAFRVNAVGPRVLALACAAEGIPLVHISTDYVFDGTKDAPYQEDDAIAPLNVYGASKAAGEDAIRRNCPRHLILRTSWVYGLYGSNFLKLVLRLVNERDGLSMVADQYGCPTATADLAEAVFALAPRLASREVAWGTYHFAGRGATTWYGLAREIVERQARLTGRRIQVAPISSAEYPSRARRPANSRLDCSKFADTFGLRARPWQQRVADIVDSLLAEGRT
jgi:dTDP-4-dehydrorhamnose reductase